MSDRTLEHLRAKALEARMDRHNSTGRSEGRHAMIAAKYKGPFTIADRLCWSAGVLFVDADGLAVDADTALALLNSRAPAGLLGVESNVNRWLREHPGQVEQAYRDEFGLPDGMDRNLLHAALWEIVRRIENCGASPALTHAVVLASDLMGAVGNQFNKPRAEDLARVVEAVGPHSTWKAACEKCGREWVAVYPVGTRVVACPGCGHFNATPELAVKDAASKVHP